MPAGLFSGGHCCSGNTLEIFHVHEIEILALTGTKFADLRAPQSLHAGCAFRGPSACSLSMENRPSLCIRYLCRELRDELNRKERKDILRLAERLGQEWEEFLALRVEE